MRKLVLIVLGCALALQACLSSAKTPTSAPKTPSPTASPTSSSTPTVTPSPTIIHFPTQDYKSTATPPAYLFKTPTPFPGVNTATPIPSSTPSVPGVGFEAVDVSGDKFYWGSCKPNSLRVTAQVSDPKSVFSVVLFARMRRLKAEIFTPWNKGTGMEHLGNGKWVYNLSANSIDGHSLYHKGWVWYQLVATDANKQEIGRTRIYMDKIKIEPCMCLTPPCGPND